MSKTVNVCSLLFLMFRNHLITSDVFCHWFTFNAVLILILICCRICLLILPNSLFVGLSNLYFGFTLKLSLWSLIVTKHCRFAAMSILLSMLKLFAIFWLPYWFSLVMKAALFCTFLWCYFELSKYIWSLKYENKYFDIKWSILKKSSGYSIIWKSCNLCLLEKLVIWNFKKKDRLLNKRLDLVSK